MLLRPPAARPTRDATPNGAACGSSHAQLDSMPAGLSRRGVNIGVQIRKLFEPERYPNASILAVYDKYFGPYVRARRKHVCAVGFEPNPHHKARLAALAARYNALGWRTSFEFCSCWATRRACHVLFRPGWHEKSLRMGRVVSLPQSHGLQATPCPSCIYAPALHQSSHSNHGIETRLSQEHHPVVGESRESSPSIRPCWPKVEGSDAQLVPVDAYRAHCVAAAAAGRRELGVWRPERRDEARHRRR